MAPPNLSIVRRYEPDPIQPERDPKTRGQVDNLMQRLHGLKDDAVSRKIQIEDRWLEDLRLFHGRYDAATEARLRANKQSRLFVNQTRAKTNSWGARLSDMLFPTDDNNWGVQPTPVPILSQKLKKQEEAAQAAAAQATQANQSGDKTGEVIAFNRGQQAAAGAQQTAQEIDIAKERAANMERTISDQFVECDYNQRNRQAIDDAVKIGTGLIKGPMTMHRVRQGWMKGEGGGYMLGQTGDPRPEYLRVDPWNWYPDMDGAAPGEMEYSFERHLLNDRELRRQANVSGFDPDVIRQVLESQSKETLPWQLIQMREITSNTIGITQSRYVEWEYHGLVTPDELELLARYSGNAVMLREINRDPLEEYACLVWMVDNRLAKWAPHPLDSAMSLYSAFNFERDTGSVFGFGVPYLMRDSQSAMNAAWRMIMDNAALTVGPQFLVDRSRVEPADGTYEIKAKKIWLKKAGSPATDTRSPIETIDIQIHLTELERILALAKQFSDDETNMPVIAMGETGSHVTKTAQGMAMLMNSVNVIFRRSVKNFDDQMTVPNVQRAYDWNMQFNKDETIKGDFDVAAKGSSVLLVRELEATNLMAIALRFTAHPVLGPLTKPAALYRRLIRAHMLPPDEIVKTDDEIKIAEDAAAKNPQPTMLSVKMEQIASAERIAKMENDTRRYVADQTAKTAMVTIAEKLNVDIEELNAMFADKAKDRDLKDRHMAVQVAQETKTGIHTGAAL